MTNGGFIRRENDETNVNVQPGKTQVDLLYVSKTTSLFDSKNPRLLERQPVVNSSEGVKVKVALKTQRFVSETV